MAIFHLSASTGSKASGQSAGAKASYIARAGKYRGDRDELVHVESRHMPAWAERGLSERSDAAALEYWRAADVHERANGRLFKQVEFALPVELATGQRVALAQDFARELTSSVDGGALPYTLAVHAGEEKNPHCHLIISERVNDGIARDKATWFRRAAVAGKDQAAGGARKTEALKPKEWLEAVREKWARFANRALELAGFAERIDHRTLEAQQVERVPQIHLGPNVSKMVARGIETDRAVAAKRVTMTNEKIVQLRQEQTREEERVMGLGARQNDAPRVSVSKPILRDPPRPPSRPIKDAFARKSEKLESLAREMVRTGQWKKIEPAVVDFRACTELIREGYAPDVVQGELIRIGRGKEYTLSTIAKATEKARQLGRDRGLER